MLLSLLNLSPGIQLADSVASHSGNLIGARIRLVSDDDRPRNLDGMTREQLEIERQRIESEENPGGLVGPIVLTAVGAGLTIPGSYLVLTGFAYGAQGGALGTIGFYTYLIAGGIMIGVGLILAIVGVVKIFRRLSAKKTYEAKLSDIDRRIDAVDKNAPPPPPPMEPPPPPPPPPQANLVVPGPMRTLMTF